VDIIKITAGLLVIAVVAIVVVTSTIDVINIKVRSLRKLNRLQAESYKVGGDLQFALSLVPTVFAKLWRV